MKKECKILLSLIYIILLSVVSFFNASEIIKEILNNNQILIFILDILINTFIFILNIVIMGFIYRVVYKILTKNTLDSRESKDTALMLLMPLLYTRLLIFCTVYILGFKSIFLLLLFINPFIYIYQLKQIKNIEQVKKKMIVILPFVMYEIVDIIGIYGNLI
ncbi:hypothetical protein SAMN04487886_105418 [Clostridium sp. DSM 8431]|nr:hypothetical protein SAMN04487886_105418 [Clostridium sp. DSM 8431]